VPPHMPNMATAGLRAWAGPIPSLSPHSPLFSSFHELIQSRGSVVCPSLCVSVNFFCANRFYYAKNGSIATKLAHDGLQVSAHPGCVQGQGQGQRSRDTGTFVLDLKSLFVAGKWLDCDQTCTRWSTGEPASRMCSRSKSRARDLYDCTKIASCSTLMAAS